MGTSRVLVRQAQKSHQIKAGYCVRITTIANITRNGLLSTGFSREDAACFGPATFLCSGSSFPSDELGGLFIAICMSRSLDPLEILVLDLHAICSPNFLSASGALLLGDRLFFAIRTLHRNILLLFRCLCFIHHPTHSRHML